MPGHIQPLPSEITRTGCTWPTACDALLPKMRKPRRSGASSEAAEGNIVQQDAGRKDASIFTCRADTDATLINLHPLAPRTIGRSYAPW